MRLATTLLVAPLVALSVCGLSACRRGGGDDSPPPSADPFLSSLTADTPGPLVADGAVFATLTATVLDRAGVPMEGALVTLVATGEGNTLVQPLLPTDALGQASGTLASTWAELKTVSAIVGSVPAQVALAQTAAVTFVGDPSTIDAALSTAGATPGAGVVANGVEVATVSVMVLDAHGNAVSGQMVTPSATGSANSFAPPSGVTDAAGTVGFTLSSTAAEQKTLTLTVNAGPGQVVIAEQPVTGFVGDPATISAALSTVSASPGAHVAADGVEVSTVTVTVRDANGNPVAGRTATLAATGAGNALVQPVGVTDAGGVTTGALASTAAETKSVSATVDPGPGQVLVTQQAPVDFVWTPPGAYFVRAAGTDPVGCSGGTTPATAWRSISKAAACAGPGATVYVGAGTYFETVTITTGGTPGNPVRFVADVAGARTGDPGAVLVDAGSANEAFHVDGASWVELEGFTVVNTLGVAPSGGIRVGPGACSNVTLRGNVLYDHSIGIYLGNVDDAVVEHNVVSDAVALGHGIVVSASDRAALTDNLVYDNAGMGLWVEAGSTDLALRGNTFFANGGDQVSVAGTALNVSVLDNVVALGLADGIDVAAPATVTLANNDVWGNLLDYDGVAPGPGDISADPLFEDPDGADGLLGGASGDDDRFQLATTPTSPALDAGSSAASAASTLDGLTLAHRTSRLDGVLDGDAPDGGVLNLGYHYPANADALPTAELGDLRAFYGDGGARDLRWRAWDESGAAWGGERAAPPLSPDLRWVVAAATPLASDEVLVGASSASGERMSVLAWSGAEWVRELSAPGPMNAGVRGFDLAYESGSGQALAVFSDTSPTPVFSARTAGQWSAPAPLPLNDGGGPNPDPNSGAVGWIELVSHPANDEVALAYSDANQDLVVIVWDGAQWSTATATTLATDLTTLGGVVGNRTFDLAWESNSGDLMAIWGLNGVAGFWWSLKPAASSTFGAAAREASTPGYAFNHADLATEPGGDRIAAAVYDHAGLERFGLAVWDGGAWVNSAQYDSFSPDLASTGVGDDCAAVGWVGTTGVAVCLFVDDDAGGLDWARWDSASGWVVQADELVAGMGFTDSIRMVSDASADRVAALVSDATGQLFAVAFDGAAWTVELPPVETALPATDSVPFDLLD